MAISRCFGVKDGHYSLSVDAMSRVERELSSLGKECIAGYTKELCALVGFKGGEVSWGELASVVLADAQTRARAALLVGMSVLWGSVAD